MFVHWLHRTSSLKRKHHLKKCHQRSFLDPWCLVNIPFCYISPNSLLHICCAVCSCPAFAQQRLPFTGLSAPQCGSHTSNQCTALRDSAFVCNVIFLWLRDTAHMEMENRSLVARVPSWLWSNCNLGLDCFSKRQQRD